MVTEAGTAAAKEQRVVRSTGSSLLNQNPWWAQTLIYIGLLLLGLVTFIPILNVLAISFSEASQIRLHPMMLFPYHFTLSAYKYIFGTPVLTRSFMVTVFITVAGTFSNLLFTASAAYGLSKRKVPGYSFFTWIIIIPMLIGAGLIPYYILMKNLGLLDSLWVFIVGGLVSPFNFVLMRNFFWSIPEGLEESASIDGAGELTILWKIILPLSKPVIATVGLFYAVGHWNDYFTGLIFINDNAKWPLQVVLRSIIIDQNMMNMGAIPQIMDPSKIVITPDNIKAAAIIFAIAPIMVTYPFLQKYFVKGIMIGSVKG
ncbi:carbohydrate ABC transporter permease [Paenibacillus protaetiae]|uniref:Carbohydrate ABC transporter permease n=1 Tax=Paenibacillus protaetiae TaxID=2509456 RepID=A0A4P6EVK9_9BACL|nr:carbohydrate ABC transporter permease [Paenibacillus protaetiae]QAY67034.1 carbohydrate ABC transporter permease [Paenibacillus protaetiae]